MSGTSTLLWIAVPYVALAVFAVGLWWRWRYDKFGWTTRSSQVYESRLLRLGSPLFHVGILLVLLGHVGGLLVPETWTGAVGISEHTYHVVAVGLGGVAGAATVVGVAILIYRRGTVGPVFSATTRSDKAMYVAPGLTILVGVINTFGNVASAYDYRQSVSLWVRGVLSFHVDTTLMAGAPLGFQVHALLACLMFAMWPFTRLVHVFSVPLGYLARPYIVYRSRGHIDAVGARHPRPGWEPTRRHAPRKPARSRRPST